MLTHTHTQNDNNLLKYYGVCMSIFLFTFCYSTIPLAVPSQSKVENVRWAQKKCFNIFFRVPSLLLLIAHRHRPLVTGN
jgi:hypothetical protein